MCVYIYIYLFIYTHTHHMLYTCIRRPRAWSCSPTARAAWPPSSDPRSSKTNYKYIKQQTPTYKQTQKQQLNNKL